MGTITDTTANINNILNLANGYVAAPFSSATTYAVGDYCSRNGKVYRCKTAGAAAWSSSRWTEVVIGDELAKGNNSPVYTSGGTVSLASETWAAVQTISLTPGLWLVEYGVSFQSNATGYRMCAFTDSSAEPSVDRTIPMSPAISGVATNVIKTGIIEVPATTTYYLWAWQNSGSSRNVYPYVRTYRVR